MTTFTVIVCVYNAPETELQDTLDSIVVQDNADFDIIIADDCSKSSYDDFVKNYFADHLDIRYRYIRNEVNLGTVKNLLNATTYATGEYIKPLGAGDSFYDEEVLFHVAEYAEQTKAGIFFGNLVGFVENEAGKRNKSYKSPIVQKCYKTNDIERIKENFLIYGDHISGACLFYEKELFTRYLLIISEEIVYVEDYIPIFAVLDGIKIAYIDKNLIYYKLGTGISTKMTSKNTERMKNDKIGFDRLIVNYAPNDLIVKRYGIILKINQYPIILKWIIKFFLIPKDIYFRFRKNQNIRCSG